MNIQRNERENKKKLMMFRKLLFKNTNNYINQYFKSLTRQNKILGVECLGYSIHITAAAPASSVSQFLWDDVCCSESFSHAWGSCPQNI